MSTIVTDLSTAPHYTWGNNCDSWVLADTVGLSVKQESMPPGTSETLHYHERAQQFFYILKGTATFRLNGETIAVGEQKGLFIKPGTKHLIANETSKPLDFLVISQPTTHNDRIACEQ